MRAAPRRVPARAARGCALALALGLGIGGQACTSLPVVEPGVCGNQVLETSAGEECDTPGDIPSGDPSLLPSRCALKGEAGECRYVWDEAHDCPAGWNKGVADNRCRRPSGTFDLPYARMPELRGRRPQVGDHDGDGQLDVMVDSIDARSSVPFYLSQEVNGFTATPGVEAAAHAALADLTEDGVADVVTTVDLSYRAGIVVRRGNSERTDDQRIYPGPTSYPGEVIHGWMPVHAPSYFYDLDQVLGLYLDPASGSPACGSPLCFGFDYAAATFSEPLDSSANIGERLTQASTDHNQQLGIVAIPGTSELWALGLGEAGLVDVLGLSGAPVFGGVVLDDLDDDGDDDVGWLSKLSEPRDGTGLELVMLPGPASQAWLESGVPATERLAKLVLSDPTAGPGGPAFGHLNQDDVPDVILPGSLFFRGGLFLSHASWSGGELLESHHRVAPLDNGVTWTRHALGDVNGDGRDDIAAAYGAGATSGIEIVLGGDLEPLSSSRTTTASPVKQVIITDLDGDGVGDIVAAVSSTLAPMALDAPACDAVDDIVVAYGRSSGYPEPFVSIGGFAGIVQLSEGRLRRPEDGAGDVGITARCTQDDAVLHRSAVLNGDPHRRPFAPFVLPKESDATSRAPLFDRVFSTVVGDRVNLIASGYFTDVDLGSDSLELGTVFLPVEGDAELSVAAAWLPLPAQQGSRVTAPLSFVAAPGGSGELVVGSLELTPIGAAGAIQDEPGLRLDAYLFGDAEIEPRGEPVALSDVPQSISSSLHWSHAVLSTAAGERVLALVTLQVADDDLFPDRHDNCPMIPNPGQGNLDWDAYGDACDDDDDGDGAPDLFDNCPTVPNTVGGAGDLDEDGKGDACDPDVDGDGVEASDNCPTVPNADQLDADDDGRGDACADLLDGDGDGVEDEQDDCAFVFNTDQTDHDGDGLGSSCDNDIDGDATDNAVDNCPVNANPDQLDLDDDGIGEACDDPLIPGQEPYSALTLLAWEASGELGEPVSIALPDDGQSSELVDVVTLEGEGRVPVLYVATDRAVFRVVCADGELPSCDGDQPELLPLLGADGNPLALDVQHITALARGDFDGDGLDDLLVIDRTGALVVPQRPL